MYEQSALPANLQIHFSGLSLLFGADRVLQELLNPKAEWSGVAVTLPHWIEMMPAQPLGLSGGNGLGEPVNLVDVANGN